ncbi:unnamed protein product [Cylicocyclus nassatus]|uniref:Uncharacterized protein n=1 Tax=Cylicocyclus nassatus TaxID=53992 RepID=A0AA36M3T2_CYLNA|nr:unnamed protein product [Cylicocyclus nassatus]
MNSLLNYVGKLGLSLLITILLPSVLIIFSLIGLFFLLVRYLADCFKESGEQKYAMRGWPSRLGACTLGFGGYIALTIAIVSIILLVVYFILAFTSMYICVGLFEDEELRVLFALPKQEIRIKIATRNITLTLHDTLYKCRNEYSFFDAINGEQIWAKKELKSVGCPSMRNTNTKDYDAFSLPHYRSCRHCVKLVFEEQFVIFKSTKH